MPIADQAILDKLGFGEIVAACSGFAQTDPGKDLVGSLHPISDPEKIRILLDEVSEWTAILEKGEDIAFGEPADVSEFLRGADVEGNWLEAASIHRLRKWLIMVSAIRSFFISRKETAPENGRTILLPFWNKETSKRIDELLDKEGNIRDGASERLRDIRKQISGISSGLRSRISAAMKKAVSNGWSAEPEFTIRNGRFVIPLKSDFKGRIQGFIQDISNSGQTVFVEPAETLELNNELRSLQSAEANEIRKILIEFTAELRPEIPGIKLLQSALAEIDLSRAKAIFARNIGAERPGIGVGGDKHELIRAWHPLLMLSGGKKREQIVPLTMHFGQSSRIVVISGPNAGGKTISMKTAGLLQLMMQSGMPVTAASHSHMRIFNSIFLDIGDDQSIQSDLSTYTSRLTLLAGMARTMNGNSLFLVDEFGSGTDPRQGGAIAEAFLERFLETGAYGIITTHYGNLKAVAEKSAGVVNAAMQFDSETLSPSFQIRFGIPGRSFAFEIARKAGVQEEILQAAYSKLDGSEIRSEELLQQIESQQSELDQLLTGNREKREELKNLIQRNRMLVEEKERKKREAIEGAEKEARELIRKANAKIEKTIGEIRKSQAEREETSRLREELKQLLPEVKKEEPAMEIRKFPGERPLVGDWVQIGESENIGELVEIKDKRAVIVCDSLRLTAKYIELVKVEAPAVQKTGFSKVSYREFEKLPSRDLNVMGMRADAAIQEVTRFIDQAILANSGQVRILHGKGSGALRKAIRDYLSARAEVKGMADESLEAGGSGWTVVDLS